ncbi:major capsid protein [Peromfec virus RodF8_26]|uniref:Major capsid protein n=1 Tax=Peromfec virus RodF8_26 TaxID=2929365 RepID=A0A976R7B0_9VIRU|nr:major capsid protein [Peromfec virus RodF8_26]
MPESVVNLAATSVRQYGKNSYKPKPFEHIYTCNTGDLIPAFATIKINPGSTWKITTSILARLNTSRYPTITRGWIEYMWTYVPHIQVWDHWNEFMGENTESAWVSQTVYTIPKISIPEGTVIENGSLLDHFGWPTKQGNFKAGALKLRAYLWSCNQIARDQNIEEPFAPDTGDADLVYTGKNADFKVGGKPYQINRKADYFSTALPEPYKGPEVLLPLGTTAPIKNSTTSNFINPKIYSNSTGGGFNTQNALGVEPGENMIWTNSTGGQYAGEAFIRMEADLSEANAPSLFAIRDAITTLHIYERDARSGTRAPEMLWARWGVEVDPLEMGRPRILNMNRFQIDFEQVPQTSASNETSPQGTLTAFGYTNNRSEEETFSFKYAGTLMCLVAIRFEHKYQYGIPEEDMKLDRFDFWHPEFTGLGDQPIYNYEIYATGGQNGTINDKSIFGYAERGAEYKNFPSLITGQVRSNYEQSMDYVHMADKYNELPTLSKEWMKENPDNLDRTIFVTSAQANQWLVDFVTEFEITDTLPLYSIPGVDRI